MKLKVCGITDSSFAARAAELKVDYLGFIFHAASPRNVSVDFVRQVVFSRKVGVFVSQSVDEILSILRAADLSVAQLHRRATPEEVATLRAAGYEVWTLAGGASGDGVLFDSSHGDGETDFKKGDYKAILAGRIGVGNLTAALALEPDILDVNSSLETEPGVKNIRKLEEFCDILRAKEI